MIRKDIDEFPFERRDKGVWYLLVDFKKKKTFDFFFVGDKADLVDLLKNIVNSKTEKEYKLFGIWHGQYSSDAFEIPLKKAYSKLKKHFIN